MQGFDKALYETAPVHKAVAKFVIPTLLSSIITIIYSMSDAFFIGLRNNPDELAGLSVAFPFYQILQGLANLWGIGTNAVMSRSLGEKNYGKVTESSMCGIWCGSLFILLTSLAFSVFCDGMLYQAGASGTSFVYAKEYVKWTIIFGGLPILLSVVMCNILRSEGHAKEAGIGLSFGGIINCILDPVFIFTFNMGVKGVAVATMLSSWLSFCYFLWVYWKIRDKTYIKIKFNTMMFKFAYIREILLTGIPSAILSLLGATGNVIQNSLYAKYGDAVMAGWGVALRINFISTYSVNGVIQGILPLVAYNFAAGNYQRVKKIIKLGIFLSAIICFSVLILAEIFPQQMIRLFIDDFSTVAGGAIVLQLYTLATPFMNFILFVSGLCQAIGKWRYSLVLLSIRQLCFNIPITIWLESLFGLRGISLGQPACDIIVTLMAAYVFWKLFILNKQEIV